MQLQVKLQKRAELMYLEAKKQETRYRLRYSDVSTQEKRYDGCSESQTTVSRLNVAFFEVTNKEIRCVWCIQSVNCNNIAMVDRF